ncbi:sialic acid O-acetyltransferase [Thomasclavelia cocleata]|uniref:PglD-related sugar-binding protein n=1 Tax=Thomasclavelia cocleata TaxID=69824 RepID=UPI00248B154D|nr:sialic acid O-acetyltransferase [Thomasclavelia cocleata]
MLIVGAGGHGRCCLDIAREYYDHIAFLDDNHINNMINDCKVIGQIDDMRLYCSEYKDIVIAIGNNKLRKQLFNKAVELGYDLISLISNKSIISNYANIDKGTVVFPNAVIEANVTVGKGCIISTGAVIDHDAVVGDYCHINALAVVSSMTKITEYTKVDYGQVYRKKDMDETWKEEYVKQFGEEPSFF